MEKLLIRYDRARSVVEVVTRDDEGYWGVDVEAIELSRDDVQEFDDAILDNMPDVLLTRILEVARPYSVELLTSKQAARLA